MVNYNKISDAFALKFGSTGLMVAAPGRVNLIGEHTDYNLGFVLPGAINRELVACIAPNGSHKVRLYSVDYDESAEFTLNGSDDIPAWAKYVYGIAYELHAYGCSIAGFDAVFGGDIPLGAGLSSSAALESAFAFGLNEIFSLGLTRMEMAKIGQRAENIHVGVNCGIMDQFASLLGDTNTLLKLDCRSLEFEPIPFALPSHSLVLLDTRVKHSLASSEYNTRRKQCEEGVVTLAKFNPNIASLRDVTLDMLVNSRFALSEKVLMRCQYVVEENTRLQNACNALANSDVDEFGRMMYLSHEGLMSKYEVSCAELDFLVEQAACFSSVLGSRMMGGGFGGCTISLVADSAIPEFVGAASAAFEAKYGQAPLHYEVKIGAGARVVL